MLLDEILYFCDYRIMNEIEGNVKEVVREKYGEAARRVATGKTSCCSLDPITSGLYTLAQSETLPEAALLASLGCGNPTALAQLQPGDEVGLLPFHHLDEGGGDQRRRETAHLHAVVQVGHQQQRTRRGPTDQTCDR